LISLTFVLGGHSKWTHEAWQLALKKPPLMNCGGLTQAILHPRPIGYGNGLSYARASLASYGLWP